MASNENLSNLSKHSLRRLVQAESAIRHAHAALMLGKVAEALVVLEAQARGLELDIAQLELLTAAKEVELVESRKNRKR